MPKLGGMELCEQILRERPALKVLLMSGTAVDQPRKGWHSSASRSEPKF